MQIRKIQESDLEQIYYILKETWLVTYPSEKYNVTKQDILKRYDDKKSFLSKMKKHFELYSGDELVGLVVEKNGKLIATSEINLKKNYINLIYVLPEFQGQGVGTALFKKLLNFLDLSKNIYLEVTLYNVQAINFYKKFGFTIIKNSEDKHKVVDKVFMPTIKMQKNYEK